MDFTSLGQAGIVCALMFYFGKLGIQYLIKQITELKEEIKALTISYEAKLKEKDERINKLIDEHRTESMENYADIREIAKNTVDIINTYNQNLAIKNNVRTT